MNTEVDGLGTDPPDEEIGARLDDAGPAAFWDVLRLTTQARIGLGRSGDGLPTRRLLEFRAAHAEARDAVHDPLDVDALVSAIEAVGIGRPAVVASEAADRNEYLRRPDRGRRPASLTDVPHGDHQVGFVLADGLSPRALAEHGAGLLDALVRELRSTYTLAPPVVAVQARVALADHIAEALGVETMIVLIGERPGLSVADSLGLYLTHHPWPGRTDADRNCISNIHPPDGLGYEAAARVATGLVHGAHELGKSGVMLKDTSHAPLEAADPRVIS